MVRRLLIAVAPLVGSMGSRCVGFSSCGSRALLFRGMLDRPRPGLKPVSPALAGGFLTTAPPGKPMTHNYMENFKFRKVLLLRNCES